QHRRNDPVPALRYSGGREGAGAVGARADLVAHLPLLRNLAPPRPSGGRGGVEPARRRPRLRAPVSAPAPEAPRRRDAPRGDRPARPASPRPRRHIARSTVRPAWTGTRHERRPPRTCRADSTP